MLRPDGDNRLDPEAFDANAVEEKLQEFLEWNSKLQDSLRERPRESSRTDRSAPQARPIPAGRGANFGFRRS